MSSWSALLIGPAVAVALVAVGMLAGYGFGRDHGFQQGYRAATEGIRAAARTEATIRSTGRHAQHRRDDVYTGTVIGSRTH